MNEQKKTDGIVENTPSCESVPAAAKRYRSRVSERTAFGYRSGVDGLESPPCPGYVPTRHELLELARYWLAERLFVDTLVFWGEPVDRQDGHKRNLAVERLDCIAAVLGPDGIQDVYRQVEEDFRRRMGEKAWNVFRHGSTEEQNEFVAAAWADDEEEAGPPEFAADLVEMAINAFPSLAAGGLAESFRAAAEYAETNGVTDPYCEHNWQVDRERTHWEQDGGEVLTVYERCTRCSGRRHHDVRLGDAGYEEAKNIVAGLR